MHDHDNYCIHWNIGFYSSLIQAYRDIAIEFIQQQAGTKRPCCMNYLGDERNQERAPLFSTSRFTNQAKTHFHWLLAKLNWCHSPSRQDANIDHVKRSVVNALSRPMASFLVPTGTKRSALVSSSLPIRKVCSSTDTCFIIQAWHSSCVSFCCSFAYTILKDDIQLVWQRSQTPLYLIPLGYIEKKSLWNGSVAMSYVSIIDWMYWMVFMAVTKGCSNGKKALHCLTGTHITGSTNIHDQVTTLAMIQKHSTSIMVMWRCNGFNNVC